MTVREARERYPHYDKLFGETGTSETLGRKDRVKRRAVLCCELGLSPFEIGRLTPKEIDDLIEGWNEYQDEIESTTKKRAG